MTYITHHSHFLLLRFSKVAVTPIPFSGRGKCSVSRNLISLIDACKLVSTPSNGEYLPYMMGAVDR